MGRNWLDPLSLGPLVLTSLTPRHPAVVRMTWTLKLSERSHWRSPRLQMSAFFRKLACDKGLTGHYIQQGSGLCFPIIKDTIEEIYKTKQNKKPER